MKPYLINKIPTILSIVVFTCCTALISIDVKRNLSKKNTVVKEIKKK